MVREPRFDFGINFCMAKSTPWQAGPCHHGMARLQVADGGTASSMEGNCGYIFKRQSRRADKEWSSSLGVGRVANNSSPQKRIKLRNSQRVSFGNGLIVWYDISNEKGTWHSVRGMLGTCIRQVHLQQQPENYGRIILGWIFRKCDVGVWAGSRWLRIRTGGEHLYCGNELSATTKCGEYLD